MDVIKGINAYDYVLENYSELLKIINGTDSVNTCDTYSNEELKVIRRLLFEEIVKKINGLKILTLDEAYLFVCKLIHETSDRLDIRIPCNFSFAGDDSKLLPEDSMGVFRKNNKNVYEIIYDKDNLDVLCGKYDILGFSSGEVTEYHYSSSISTIIVLLITFPHELVHVKQLEDKYVGKISLVNFLLTLEHVLFGGSYYKENEIFTYEEFYANVNACDLLFDFLRKYKIFDETELFCLVENALKNQYDNDSRSIQKHTVLETGINTFISIDDYLLFGAMEFVKKDPRLIKTFPLLKLVFSEDGNLRTVSSLFEKRLAMINEGEKKEYDGNFFKELDKIYEFIFKSFYFMFGKDIIIEQIKTYLDDNVDEKDCFAKIMLDMCNGLDVKEINELSKNVQRRLLQIRKNRVFFCFNLIKG